MTGYNSQVGGGKYCIQYETDSRENYREVEELIHRQIDGKSADVPDTNDGEIALKQAIEAVRALKEYCEQISVDTCLNGNCPMGAWCFNDRKSEPTPATWKIPQERTEE